VKKFQVIGIEDLDLKGISRFLRNAKNVGDTSWRNFTTRLERKAWRFNSVVIRADKWYASSKLCSCCGFKKNDLKLSDREWTCPECGTHHSRDINAAINLKHNALSTLGSRESEACGDYCLYPAEAGQASSMKQERLAAKPSKNGSHLQ